MAATVSVGIVTFHSAAHIRSCLEAVRAQTRAPGEVVVWDNASPDASAELAREAGAAVVTSSVNVGFAAAANELILRTTGSYVLLLNPDAVLAPDYLARLVDAGEADPRVGSLTGKLVRPDDGPGPRVIDSAGHVLYRNRWACNRGEGEPDRGQYDDAGEVFGVCAAAALYRRAMLDDVRIGDEYFASAFFAYLEDVDLDWRARLRGWRAWYVPAAVAVHERGHRGKRRTRHVGALRHSVANRYLVLLRNDTGRDLLRDLPGVLLLELLRFGDYAVTHPGALRGYVDVLRLLPGALAARRRIQGRRTVSRAAFRVWLRRPRLAATIRARRRVAG